MTRATSELAKPNGLAAISRLQNDVDARVLRDLTPDLCLNGRFPAVKTPRSSDRVHLRTAEWFLLNGGLAAFVTLDDSQRESARQLGLPLLN